MSLGQTALRFASCPLLKRLISPARVLCRVCARLCHTVSALMITMRREVFVAVMHHTSSQDQSVGVVLLWRVVPHSVCPLSLSPSSAYSAPPWPSESSSSQHLSTVAMRKSYGGLFHPSIIVPCNDCSTRRGLKLPSLETASSTTPITAISIVSAPYPPTGNLCSQFFFGGIN